MENNDYLKYKYVVVGYGYKYYDYVYRQIESFPGCKYINTWPTSRWSSSLYAHYLVSFLPYKKILVFFYMHFLKNVVRNIGLDQSDKVCFLLLAGGVNNDLLKYGLCESIRSTFINSRVVYFISDLVNKTHQPVTDMKKHADLVYSFDPMDCNKYDLINHVIPYSEYPFSKDTSPKYDIVFVGAAKDRLKDILSTYFYLSHNGVRCKFIIIDAPESEKVMADGIIYSGRITYEENINLLMEGNCILDIIQGEGTGNTIRVGEAIIMGKKLLTNNIYTPYNGVYDEKNMRFFADVKDIDINFILDRTIVSYDNKEKIYPLDFLRDIDEKLQQIL